MRYAVISKWCGWFGGWGSESDIASALNAVGPDWRLVRSENAIFAWMWLIPRRKIVFVFERLTP
jgi:hypothetical protein